MTTIDHATVTTPVGTIILFAREGALIGFEFADHPDRTHFLRSRLERHLGAIELRASDDPAGATTRIAAYFGGDLGALDRQRVTLFGTEFERAVWEQLRRIPAGTTISYRELAARVGSPRGFRAAGSANGRNPVALFVPCHRVIAADGSLGGYGGGLDRKRRLLEHEGAVVPALV
jgi:methylated-DNA-[protein]-cysteine S-methyltransferase